MAEVTVPVLAGLKSVEPLTNPIVIADVHLAANKPKTIMAFLRFLKDVAPRYAELVILGDLFDYWMGDDATPDAEPIIATLKLYSATGRRLLVMPGDRDLLIGPDFARACGAELLSDPIVISVKDVPVLFAHGDEWCVRHRPYQAWRRITHSPAWQASVLSQPVTERVAMLQEAEDRAVAENPGEVPPAERGIIESSVAESARAAGVELVIHGHTHRPGAHVNAVIERWELPSWEFDREGCAKSGWITFREGGRPQIQLL